MLDTVLLFFGALSLFYGVYLLFAEYRFHKLFAKEMKKSFAYGPAVSIIAPTKGPEPHLEYHIKGLLNQAYPKGKVHYIFVLDSKDDPAYSVIKKLSKGKDVQIVFSNILPTCSGKISALLTGLEHAKNEVLVFADTDGKPGRYWLRHLVARLEQSDVTSGYRFYLPDKSVKSYLRCAWNNIGLSQIFNHRVTFPWAGSMAVRKKDFYSLDMPKHWQRAVSDDLTFSERVKKAGMKISYEPRCLVFTKDKFDLHSFVRFTNRQMIILRAYLPKLNALALVGIGGMPFFTLLGLASVLLGSYVPAGLLFSIVPLYMVKEALRFDGYRRNAGVQGSVIKYSAAGYLAAWLFAYNALQALFRNKIEWRGRKYIIHGPDNIEII